MKNRRRFGIIVTICALGLGLWFGLSKRQDSPSYQGNSIEYWFKKSTPSDSRLSPEAKAFQAMGPAAVPFLRKMLREDTRWEGFYRTLYKKLRSWLPLWLTAHLPAPALYGYRQHRAAMLLGFIGPPAKAAAPDLVEAYKISCAKVYNFPRNMVTNWASPSLKKLMSQPTAGGSVGETVVRTGQGAFLLFNPGELRAKLIEDMGKIGGANREIVPVLITALREPDNEIHAFAISAIKWGNLTEASEASTGALARALNDRDDDVRASAAHLLGFVVAKHVEFIPPLIQCLSDTDAQVRAEVRRSLREAPNELVEPRLIEALTGTNAAIRVGAGAALSEVVLKNENNPSRWNEAIAFGQIGPQAKT